MQLYLLLVVLLLNLFTLQAQQPSARIQSDQKKARTLVAFFAHPDDEVCVSPMLARYAREGVNIYLVLATSGQKGVMPHFKVPTGDSLGRIRTAEATCATELLGIHPPIMLGLQDGALSLLDNMVVLHNKVDSLFKLLKPDVVITWGPDGGYGHADHRIVSDVVTEVFQKGGEGWPRQLFYAAVPLEPMKNLPPLKTFFGNWLSKSFHFTQEKYLTCRVPYNDQDLKLARSAYACHKSQFTPDVMDEIFVLLTQAGKVTYLRPWSGSGALKPDVFK